MRVAVLAGGIGAARFLSGLIEVTGSTVESPTISVISNTGDDIRLFGLQICPDLDSVMYNLGGGADTERGWGRANETYTVLSELKNYGAMPDWFTLGDRDFATHIVRTQMLEAGYPLSAVTAALAKRWQLPIALLPMTDSRVETHVIVNDPDTGKPNALHFQEWWVRHRAALAAQEFIYIGADAAHPGPGVLDAITKADLIVLPPSNPVVSIEPILQVPGIRQALVKATAPIIGVSPIVGGAAVRGMADACLQAIGVRTDAVAVAAHYGARSDGGLLDAWVLDEQDSARISEVEKLGIRSAATDTIFAHPGVGTRVAELVIAMGTDTSNGESA